MKRKLNLKTLAYLFFALQIAYWTQTGFTLPEGPVFGVILYEIGCHVPLLIGILLMVLEIIRIKKQ